MVTALVMLKIEPKKIQKVAESLANVKYVSEVYSVSGRYDVVAVVRTPDNETLSDIVTNELVMIEGLVSSETLVAFRVFSSYDLERMFDID